MVFIYGKDFPQFFQEKANDSFTVCSFLLKTFIKIICKRKILKCKIIITFKNFSKKADVTHREKFIMIYDTLKASLGENFNIIKVKDGSLLPGYLVICLLLFSC